MAVIQPVTIPQWGITMTEGTLVKWNASEGDEVKEKDEIAEIETEKIVNVLESPSGGILRKLIGKEGDTLPVGALIGIIADESQSDDDIKKFIQEYKPIELASPSQSQKSEESETSPSQTSVTSTPGVGQVSPAVKRLAKKLGVDLENVSGSGRNGRITKEDVELASQGVTQTPQNGLVEDSDNPYTSIPFTSMRKTIAKRLTESKQTIPHFYLTADYSIDKLIEKYRFIRDQKIKERVEALGVQVQESDDREILLQKERQYLLEREKIENCLESYYRSASSLVFQLNKRHITRQMSIFRCIDRRFETGEIFIKWDESPDEEWLILICLLYTSDAADE